MIVALCSMRSLAIAHGLDDNLLTRSAAVQLTRLLQPDPARAGEWPR
ncbi:MAG: hypothetical protein R3D56_04135 [Paracoccaceae bacterium]